MNDKKDFFRGITLFAALILAALLTPSALAANFNAGTEAELVTAINTANGNGAADTITLTADITLTAALPKITSEITIEGAGVTLARDAGAATDFSVLYVTSTGSLNVKQIVVTGGTGTICYTDYVCGGGIWNSGTLTMMNSTVSGSWAYYGGGISNFGTLTMANSTLSGNSSYYGAGISNFGMLTMTNSTISNNSATSDGGGISNFGTLTMTNSTISGNAALGEFGTGGGGGVWNNGTLTVANSTISDNRFRGIYHNGSSGVVTVSNSIVANNSPVGWNCDGAFITNGANFSDDASCAGFTQSAFINLEVLANNGGPTQTHALLPGSSAVDAAASCALTNDQRGMPRNDGFCDAGAYEYEPATGIVVLTDPYPAIPPSPDIAEGLSRRFRISLTSRSEAPVTIPVSVSGDPLRCSLDLNTVILDSANGIPGVLVTVSAIDDGGAVVGDQPCDLITGDPASTDIDYDTLTASDSPDVSIMVFDPNTIEVKYLIAPRSTILEGFSDIFRIALGSKPSADVFIPISISDPAQCSVDINTAVLTEANWKTGITATISGIHDIIHDGDQPCDLITGDPSSADADYDGLNEGDTQDFNILIIDYDPPADVNLIVNGDFSAGRTPWEFYGSIGWSIGSGVMGFYRTSPGWKVATAFQRIVDTPIPSGTDMEIRAEVGNSSSVPKGVEILFRDRSWKQYMTCSFTIPPNTPLTQVVMQDTTAVNWIDPVIAFRAFDPDGIGYITLDNVSVAAKPYLNLTGINCTGYETPAKIELLTNGDFSDRFRYWMLWGDYTFTVNAGVMEFYRKSGATKNAVLFAEVAYHMQAGQELEMSMQVGNSSGVTKNIQILLRDVNWAQNFQCNFTLPAYQPLTTVKVRGTTTKQWGRPMVIIRALDADGIPAVLVDNASLQYKPGLDTTTQCDGGSLSVEGVVLAQPSDPAPAPTDPPPPAATDPAPAPTDPPSGDPPPAASDVPVVDTPVPAPTDPPANDPAPGAAPTDPPPPAPNDPPASTPAPTYTLADLEAALVCVTHGGASQSLTSHLDDLPQLLELLDTHTANGNVDAACADKIQEIAEGLIQ